MRIMIQSILKQVRDQEVPEEFLCPISQCIMSNPVFTPQGITYQRIEIQKWIQKNGVCPLTRKTLSKEDLKPNRALSDAILRYAKNCQKKMKQGLEEKNIYQIALLREKELQSCNFQTPSPQKKFLEKELQILKKQFQLQRQQKMYIARQREIYSRKAAIKSDMVRQYEYLNVQLKNENALLKQEIIKRSQEIDILQKENSQIKSFEKVNNSQISRLKNILKDCQCQKRQSDSVPKLRSSKSFTEKKIQEKVVKLTVDTNTFSWKQKKYIQSDVNKKICIANNGLQWLCSFDLPSNECVFTFKVINIKKQIVDGKDASLICFGIMESSKKDLQISDTWNYCVILSLPTQKILRPTEDQKKLQKVPCSCQRLINQTPSIIACHVNRQSNIIKWHYNERAQEKSQMPKSWKDGRKLCAVVQILSKGDIVEFI